MRGLIIVSLAALAACSSGGEEAKEVEAVADALATGEWEVSQEMASIKATDNAPTTALKAKAGDKATARICIGAEEGAKPPPSLFAAEGYSCEYRNSYIRGGRLNAELKCTHAGMSGDVMMSVDGSFTADGFDADVNATSYLPGEGDFQSTTKAKGRRVGECPAEAAAPKSS